MEIKDVIIVLCTNRFDFSNPPVLTAPPLSCAMTSWQDQGMGAGRSGARHWKSSASSQTEAEIGSWGQSQRAEEAPCLGTHGANFCLDPASQASAKSSVNLSSVLLKPVFLLSLIDWFGLAPSDRATVHRQKGKPFLFENLPEDKALYGPLTTNDELRE